MTEQTPQIAGDRDRVFNVETIRALRRKARSRASMIAIGFVLAYGVLWGIAALFPASPVVDWVARAYALAIIVTVLWMAMPPREFWHELRQQIVWDIARKFDWEHKLPAEYQSLADDEAPSEPPAVPALVAGRAPLDWAIVIGLPAAVALRIVVVRKVPLGIGLIGCIVFGAYLVHLSRGGLMRPTFSPEENNE